MDENSANRCDKLLTWATTVLMGRPGPTQGGIAGAGGGRQAGPTERPDPAGLEAATQGVLRDLLDGTSFAYKLFAYEKERIVIFSLVPYVSQALCGSCLSCLLHVLVHSGKGKEVRLLGAPQPVERITYHAHSAPLHRIKTDNMLPSQLLTPFQACVQRQPCTAKRLPLYKLRADAGNFLQQYR